MGTTFERPGGWVSRLHFIALLHVWHFVPCAKTARQPFHHILAEEGAISGRSWPGCCTKRVICYAMFWINMTLWCYDIVITHTHMYIYIYKYIYIYIYIYCQKLRAIVGFFGGWWTGKARPAPGRKFQTFSTSYKKSMVYRIILEMQKQWSTMKLWGASTNEQMVVETPLKWLNQWTNEPMNQWINSESVNQWVNEIVSRWIHEAVKKMDQWLMNQWINDRVGQWVDEPWTHETVNQKINKPIIQWTNTPMNQCIHESMNHEWTHERMDG